MLFDSISTTHLESFALAWTVYSLVCALQQKSIQSMVDKSRTVKKKYGGRYGYVVSTSDSYSIDAEVQRFLLFPWARNFSLIA